MNKYLIALSLFFSAGSLFAADQNRFDSLINGVYVHGNSPCSLYVATDIPNLTIYFQFKQSPYGADVCPEIDKGLATTCPDHSGQKCMLEGGGLTATVNILSENSFAAVSDENVVIYTLLKN